MAKINSLRGQLIKKSIDYYLLKKPITISYDNRGNIIRKLYTRKDLAKELGVWVSTIRNWEKTGSVARLFSFRLSAKGIVPENVWKL